MTTALIDHAAQPSVSFFSANPSGTIEKNEGANGMVRGMKVFRTGSLKDSLGRQHTWTPEELDAIVTHFDQLRTSGAFPYVPVRVDHSASADSVVGYFANLARDGDFIVADVEFTEPEALAKWERGTYRGRSLEISAYETNDEQRCWPVALGLAFVDLPAVEGLYRRSDPTPIIKEPTVPDEKTTPQVATFRINSVPTTDVATIQSYIDELEKRPVSAGPLKFRFGTEEIQ